MSLVGRRWNWAAVLEIAMALVVLAACLMPMEGGGPAGVDKLQHFAAYAGLAFWGGVTWSARRWQVCIALLVMGALIEGLQGLTGYRSADWHDMLANSIGVVSGLAISRLPPARWLAGWLAQSADKQG